VEVQLSSPSSTRLEGRKLLIFLWSMVWHPESNEYICFLLTSHYTPGEKKDSFWILRHLLLRHFDIPCMVVLVLVLVLGLPIVHFDDAGTS
jgi:hypothetical protein